MNVLLYNEIDPQHISGFNKLLQFLKQDDFKSADVKKIQNNLYRAKLNRSDRILFSIYHYENKKYILILEYLKNHDYQSSRFLNGESVIDESEINNIEKIEDLDQAEKMVYINPNNPKFIYLNKFISFDDVQEKIYQQAPPLMIIGSAGSGKTAILLEKMKKLSGKILYVTLSDFLVKNSRALYFSDDYYNPDQEVDFYSFDEFIESIEVPIAKEADLAIFSRWYRENENSKKYNIQNLYEEFKGVLTGAFTEQAFLSEAQYIDLGIKQSIFNENEKIEVYKIFTRYLKYLTENNYYGSNILSFEYLKKVKPLYDYVVIDEVQDITAIQLYLILNSLKQSGLFLLCGDANQIVHPNFFSWSKIKTLFYKNESLHDGLDITHILHHNYRNSQCVTEISNRVLLLKNARFGSIDKESHYLVETNADLEGGIFFLKNNPHILSELDQKTAISTQFAIIVMHEEQKKLVQRIFKTPLVFSIQEAKGLEYKNIILYDFISSANNHFTEICRDIKNQDLQRDFKYARNKDKTDKSLEVYKFYINALYVGLTRAMHNLYWVEKEDQHRIFHLLGLDNASTQLDLTAQESSLKEWQKEAKRLELQGKTEQAERIRKEILKEEKPNWIVLTDSALKQLEHQALVQGDKKAKLQLFEYAVVYQHQRYLSLLAKVGFKPAQQILSQDFTLKTEKAWSSILNKYYMDYQVKHPTALMKKIQKFGVNFSNEFGQTPLLSALIVGNGELFQYLIEEGADLNVVDSFHRNLWQIALKEAILSPKYANHFFKNHYKFLPQDSLILQYEQKMFKLESQQAEYVIFQILYLMFYIRGIQEYMLMDQYTNTDQLMRYIANLPEKLVPEHRKKRTYLSALLARHEVNSKHAYNKKLFKRVKRGEYILNPALAIKIQGEWQALYAAMGFDRIDFYPNTLDNQDLDMFDKMRKMSMELLFEEIGHPKAKSIVVEKTNIFL